MHPGRILWQRALYIWWWTALTHIYFLFIILLDSHYWNSHSFCFEQGRKFTFPSSSLSGGCRKKHCQTDTGFSMAFKWRVTVIWQIYQCFSCGSYPICSISTLPQRLTHRNYEIHAWVEAGGHTRGNQKRSPNHTYIVFGFVRTIKWESGKSFSKSWNHPRLRVPALLGCLMKAIPAPVSTTAALLGLLKPRRFCPGACVRLAHGGPHRSL